LIESISVRRSEATSCCIEEVFSAVASATDSTASSAARSLRSIPSARATAAVSPCGRERDRAGVTAEDSAVFEACEGGRRVDPRVHGQFLPEPGGHIAADRYGKRCGLERRSDTLGERRRAALTGTDVEVPETGTPNDPRGRTDRAVRAGSGEDGNVQPIGE